MMLRKLLPLFLTACTLAGAETDSAHTVLISAPAADSSVSVLIDSVSAGAVPLAAEAKTAPAPVVHPASELLPKRMIITQRILWGENGIMRKKGIVPLTRENRFKELQVREKIFVGHRILGYITSAEMLASGIIGWKMAETKNEALVPVHNALTTSVNVTYFSGLSLALFTPPPAENSQGWTVKAHKILSTIHLAGMITTDLMGNQTSGNWENGNKVNPTIHKGVAIGTFATYTLGSILVHF